MIVYEYSLDNMKNWVGEVNKKLFPIGYYHKNNTSLKKYAIKYNRTHKLKNLIDEISHEGFKTTKFIKKETIDYEFKFEKKVIIPIHVYRIKQSWSSYLKQIKIKLETETKYRSHKIFRGNFFKNWNFMCFNKFN